ncbi:MAG: hypothetical protein KDI19_09695, partial [Pseudomonadales bacterium]|nr:hypothetical protein [Pseudomonadales bacterium]
MSHFNVTLERTRRLSASTLDFRFRRDDGETVSFEPGQFFRFTFTDDDGEFERSYSLCNYDESETPTSALDLVVSWVDGGRASKLLFSGAPNISARVTGPYGRLLIPAQLPRRLFLVATSVGIAPYMPMLARLATPLARGEVQVYFLFGARGPD